MDQERSTPKFAALLAFLAATLLLAISAFHSSARAPVTAMPGNTLPVTNTTGSANGTPTPMLYGHVTWQGIGQPDPRNVGITVTIRPCLVSGTPTTAPTDASGYFTMTLDSLPCGSGYAIKGVRNITQTGPLNCNRGTIEFGVLLAGDANNDGYDSAPDFSLLRNDYGQAGTGLSADFNNDGVVSAVDFTLLRSNFGFGPIGCPLTSNTTSGH